MQVVVGGDDYSRWEIGEEPQPVYAATVDSIDYSRWEIGEEPQRAEALRTASSHYSRWEIGEEPQLVLGGIIALTIIADGRSGRSRNQHARRYGHNTIIADGRSGRSRNRNIMRRR